MDRETLFRTAIDANKDRIYRLCCSLVADEDARQDAYQVDAEDRRKFRLSMILFLVAGVFYASLFGLTWIAPPDDFPALHRVILSALALAFLSIGLLHRRKSRGLARVDYAEPVLAFLSAAERRCQFLQPKDLAIVIPYLLLLAITCSAGLMPALQRYTPALDAAWGLLICCILFPLAGMGVYVIGQHSWRQKRQPLLQQIQRMQIALEAGNMLHDEVT